MMKKGIGISAPIVVVLSISLAAVFMVYLVLKPQFGRAGNAFDAEVRCLEVETKPISCEIIDDEVRMRVQLVRGDIDGVVAVLRFGDENVRTKKLLSPELKKLEVVQFSVPVSEFGRPRTLQSTSIIDTPSGEIGICKNLSEEISCE